MDSSRLPTWWALAALAAALVITAGYFAPAVLWAAVTGAAIPTAILATLVVAILRGTRP